MKWFQSKVASVNQEYQYIIHFISLHSDVILFIILLLVI
jgi:hypothetical protein